MRGNSIAVNIRDGKKNFFQFPYILIFHLISSKQSTAVNSHYNNALQNVIIIIIRQTEYIYKYNLFNLFSKAKPAFAHK